jgi:hypothetical protein
MARTGQRKRRVEPEMLVGVSAVLIGVCALGVSLYETHLMREEQRSSVLPILELARSFYVDSRGDSTADWRLELHVENVGIGPARVADFRVTVDGQPHKSWRGAMAALLGRDIDVAYGQSSINGRTIPPLRSVKMFDLVDTELTAELVEEFGRLDFEACYCSVFDECWTSSYSKFGASTPVDECRRSDASFEE